MKIFWLWLAGVLQRRQEKRVARCEEIANRLIAGEDPDYARLLGILPPLLMPTANYIALLSQSGAQQSQRNIDYAQMMGAQQQQMPSFTPEEMLGAQKQHNSARMQMMGSLIGGLGGPAGAAMGNMLGAAMGNALGNMKGRH